MPSGPDYLCGLCEDGTTSQDIAHSAAYRCAERCAHWNLRHAVLRHIMTGRHGEDPATAARCDKAMAHGTPPWVTPIGRSVFTVAANSSTTVKHSWAAAGPCE